MGYINGYDFSLLNDQVIITDYNRNNNCKIVENKNLIDDKNNIITNYNLILSKFKNNDNKLVVEIGSGNGHLINKLAIETPDINFLGIEMRQKRIVRCREKQVKNNTQNLCWICGEAFYSIFRYIGDNTVERFLMTFPDPWPKKRHAKNRLFKQNFVDLFYTKLKTGGEFIFVTDDNPYYLEAANLVREDKRFVFNDSIFEPELTLSLFGDRWKQENRTIYQFRLLKL